MSSPGPGAAEPEWPEPCGGGQGGETSGRKGLECGGSQGKGPQKGFSPQAPHAQTAPPAPQLGGSPAVVRAAPAWTQTGHWARACQRGSRRECQPAAWTSHPPCPWRAVQLPVTSWTESVRVDGPLSLAFPPASSQRARRHRCLENTLEVGRAGQSSAPGRSPETRDGAQRP